MATVFVHYKDKAFTAALRQKWVIGLEAFFDPSVNHRHSDSHAFTIKTLQALTTHQRQSIYIH